MKKAIGLFILIVALGWTAWPYYAVFDFAKAIDQGDQVALEHRVDWDSVRRGLRDDLSAFILENISKNDRDTSPLATGLVALLGSTIVNNVIDSFVTPRGLASAIRSGKASIPNAAQIGNSAADQSSASRVDDKQQDRLHWEQVRYAFFSGSPLTFRVDIAPDKTQSGQQRSVTLLFKWAGDWKLSRLFLPLDATQNAQAQADKAKHDPVVRELTQAEADNVTTQVQPIKPELNTEEVAALRTRLAKLWVPPAGAKTPEELIVQVRFQALNRERRLVGTPVAVTQGSSALFIASRDSALRAVVAAQPFTMLWPEHYEAWKEIEDHI